jgi:hypothetical protein
MPSSRAVRPPSNDGCTLPIGLARSPYYRLLPAAAGPSEIRKRGLTNGRGHRGQGMNRGSEDRHLHGRNVRDHQAANAQPTEGPREANKRPPTRVA